MPQHLIRVLLAISSDLLCGDFLVHVPLVRALFCTTVSAAVFYPSFYVPGSSERGFLKLCDNMFLQENICRLIPFVIISIL